MATVAERVQELIKRVESARERDKANPSVSAFEKQHEISNGLLRKLANGAKPNVSAAELMSVALAFGVSMDWLMGGEAPTLPPPTVTRLDDRYASREEALALADGIVANAVIESVRRHDLQSQSDPGMAYWQDLIKRRAKERADLMNEVPVDPSETAPKKRK